MAEGMRGDLELGVCSFTSYDRESKTPEGSSDGASPSPSSSYVRREHVLAWHVQDVTVGGGRKKKCLLRNIAGQASTGDFLVVMGPSGSGKTSLLECLSLRNRGFTGALHLDGESVGSGYFTKTAFVYQKDMLAGYLTPREHLVFHATARMGKQKYTAEERSKRVEEVLYELNLDRCADTIIGGTEALYMQKGLSGGERQRVAIAAELLLHPTLIFLDEPTSGLDSMMAETVVECLTKVAANGAIVVASLHSPSSSIAQHFSHVLLLTSDGRLAYQGQYEQATSYFSQNGYVVPKNFLPAEFLLCIVSKKPVESVEAYGDRLDVLVKQYATSAINLVTDPLQPEYSHQQQYSVTGQQLSWYDLLLLNQWRNTIRWRRELLMYMLWNLSHLNVGFIFGLLYLNQAGSNWRSIVGLLFIVVAVTLFVAGVPLLIVFPLDFPKTMREYLTGSNSMVAFLVSYWTYHIPYLSGPIILSTLVFWMSGLGPLGFLRYLMFVGIMMLVDCATVSVCMFLATFSINPLIGLLLAPAAFFPMIIFSGVLYQRSAVPFYLKWLENTSIVNYGFTALLGTQREILPPRMQKAVLSFCEVDPHDVGRSALGLVAITVVCTVLTYLSLKARLVLSKTNL